MARTGVVVAEYNELSRGNLYDQMGYFDKLSRQVDGLDVVIVDDGSTDGSSRAVRDYMSTGGSKMSALYRDSNGRKVGAIRDGVEYLRKDVDQVVLMDFDTRIVGGTARNISKVSDEMRSDRRAGAGSFKYTTHGSGLLARLQKYECMMNFNREISCVPGAGGIWRREALEQVLPLHSGIHEGDDAELTMLVRNGGYGLRRFDEVVVSTRVPESYRDLSRQRGEWVRGGVRVMDKFGSQRLAMLDGASRREAIAHGMRTWINWISVPVMGAAVLNSTLTGDPSYALSVYGAEAAMSGILVAGSGEKFGGLEAAATLPLMPIYNAAFSYQRRARVVAPYLLKMFASGVRSALGGGE